MRATVSSLSTILRNAGIGAACMLDHKIPLEWASDKFTNLVLKPGKLGEKFFCTWYFCNNLVALPWPVMTVMVIGEPRFSQTCAQNVRPGAATTIPLTSLFVCAADFQLKMITNAGECIEHTRWIMFREGCVSPNLNCCTVTLWSPSM